MRHYLTSLCLVMVLLLSPSITAAASYYWTGAGLNNGDGNKEWGNPNNWNLDGYATGTIPIAGPTLGSSAGPYDDVFLSSSTSYLGGITTSASTTYQRINNLTVDAGYNRFGGRYTTNSPDLRIDGDFTVADGAQFFTGPHSPNQIDFHGAFTVGNGSVIGINGTSDSGYWNLSNATSIALGGTTIRDMTNNWRWNPPRWDFGTAPITLANANTFNLPQDVVNAPRDGINSRGSLQQSIGNAITGTGGITKTGAATLILDNAANDYAGATTINAGILQANGGGAIGDSSAVTLADAQSSVNEGSVKATLSLGASETIGSLSGGGTTGGNVILNGNTLTTGGNGDSTTFAGVIAGSATGATQGARTNQGTTWDQEPYAPEGHLYAPEPALGAGSLVKTGSGTLELTAANLYSGTTTVNEGVLRISNATALGDTAGNTTVVATGAMVELEGDITVAEPITISGYGISWRGALSSLSGTNTWSGPITVAGTGRIGVGTANTFTITGGITGTGTPEFVGASGSTIRIATNPINVNGTLHVADRSVVLLDIGGNIWGNTSINYGGTLKLGVDDAMPTATVVSIGTSSDTLDTSGTLDLNGHNQTIAGLQDYGTADRRVVNSGAGTPTLTVNNSADYTFAGTLGNTSQNGFALTKDGAGVLTLSGANTYTGATDVNDGTLIVNGSIASSVLTSVAVSATLGGSGELGATSVAGTVAPGTSPGTLTTGDLTLLDSSILAFDLGTPGIVGGGVNDLIAVSGDLDVDDGTVVVDVTSLSGFGVGTYTLLTFSGSIFGDESNFQVGSAPAGLAAYQLIVNSFIAGGGNVQLMAVPEPSAFILAALGCLSIGLVGRRRKKR